ncbi:dihydrofolate reductase [Nesterenkonia xinjiangensis]|uniref:dihydrofolate reductase n=1 Tax=Nesterenkonia xinjiangensis TaxID=225327 RepID=A0A7Z0GK37_9MICC|nr:dihydrofolate reductase [Nesterenkonia xinjiangensis]NYJ77445.1 dihydrofolate reductase [Nesterenkonia xinjiangensis]
MNAPHEALGEQERTGPWVGMIWAQTRDGVIGRDGEMPWHLPEDFAHFRAQTRGRPVVMGRRTWESLPEKARPLPGRRNIVITGNSARAAEIAAAGAETTTSLDEALALAAGPDAEGRVPEKVWVLGGGRIYTETVDRELADTAVITVIDLDADGDTWAPQLPPSRWELCAADPAEGWHTAANGLRYRFETLCRRDGEISAED